MTEKNNEKRKAEERRTDRGNIKIPHDKHQLFYLRHDPM